MCGIVGTFGLRKPFHQTFDALFQEQHRGDEGAGVVFSDGKSFIPPAPHHLMGFVRDCQKAWSEEIPKGILLSLGHLRYGTSGKHLVLENLQPFVVESRFGHFAIAHNGDIPRYEATKAELADRGATFFSSSDTEVIAHMIASEPSPTLKEAIACALSKLRGAFSLIIASPDTLFAARDPWGYRPLALAKFQRGFVVVSETCALDVLRGAKYLRDIEPGELVSIDAHGVESLRFSSPPKKPQHCVFELIYFSRPDCLTFRREVAEFREALGRKLAEEYPVNYDDMVLSGIPDSSLIIAEGYAKALGIPTTTLLIRHHHADRTFIMAGEENRQNSIRLKFNPIRYRMKGRTVVLIDDSIVRGTTMRRIVRMVRRCKPKRVVTLIASPPICHPCRYGIDMKTEDELIAAQLEGDKEAIRRYIEADELYYLSMRGLQEVVGEHHHNFCYACFNGDYAL